MIKLGIGTKFHYQMIDSVEIKNGYYLTNTKHLFDNN